MFVKLSGVGVYARRKVSVPRGGGRSLLRHWSGAATGATPFHPGVQLLELSHQASQNYHEVVVRSARGAGTSRTPSSDANQKLIILNVQPQLLSRAVIGATLVISS